MCTMPDHAPSLPSAVGLQQSSSYSPPLKTLDYVFLVTRPIKPGQICHDELSLGPDLSAIQVERRD